MGWWGSWGRRKGIGEPPDYYREGLKLADQEKYHEALTSFRLALRRTPDDPEIMQQMAVVYTHIGMTEEAIKFYQAAIETEAHAPAAHYGLAFLLVHRGDLVNARAHLEAFLANPPAAAEAEAHVAHARKTLDEIDTGDGPEFEQRPRGEV